MNFINTMNLLSQQAKGKQIPLEAALELIRTYLTELRHHTGSSVEKCPMEDRVLAAANLAAVSNDMNYIFQYHKKSFTEEQDRYAQALTRANGFLENHNQEMSRLQEQIQACEAVNERLEAAVDEQTRANEALEQLRRQRDALEQRLAELSPEDPESEAARLQAQIQEKSETLTLRTTQFDEGRQRLGALVQQIGALEIQQQSQAEALAAQEARLQELNALLTDGESRGLDLEQQYQSLSDRLTLQTTDTESKKEEREALLQQLQLQQEALAEAEQKLTATREAHRDLTAKEEALHQQQADLAQKLAQIHATCDNLSLQIQAQQEQLAQGQDTVEGLTRQKQELLEQLQHIDAETHNRQQLVTEAEQSLQQQTEALEQVNTQLAAAEAQKQALTEQEAQRQLQLEQTQSQCTQLQQQLEALTGRITEEQQHQEQLQQQLRDSEANSEQQRQSIAALERSISEEQTYTAELLNRLEELEMALNAKQTDNRMFLEGHVEPMQQRLDEAIAQEAEEQQHLQDLTLELEQKESQRQTIAGESMLLQSQLSKKKKQLEQQQAQHEELKASIEAMEARLREMANAWTPLLNREKELQQRLDGKNVAQLQEEINSGIQRLEAENARADEMEQQLAQLKPRLSQLQEKVRQLAAELERSTGAEDTLSQQHDALQQRLEEITSPTCRQRAAQLSNQLELMRRIMKSLSPDGKSDGITTEDLRRRMDQVGLTLSQLRKAVRDYTALREQALNSSTMM